MNTFSFPLRLQLSQAGVSLPLAHVSNVKRVVDDEDPNGQRVRVDFSPEVLNAENRAHPYRDGRDWTAYLVTFEPTREYDQFEERTQFYICRFRDGEFTRQFAPQGSAFSVFLSPLKNAYLEAMMSRGVGTLKDLSTVNQSRNLFQDLSDFLTQLPEASSADLGSSLTKDLLEQLSLDFSPEDTPMDIASKLLLFKANLGNFSPAAFAESRVKEAIPQLLANAFSGLSLPLVHINLALNAFATMENFARRQEFRFYNLSLAEADKNGFMRLEIPEADRADIRLDENTDGEGGKDLRHVLCYHYRSAPKEPRSLSILSENGTPSIALSTDKKGGQLETSQEGNSFTFGPSLSLQSVTRFAQWEVRGSDLLRANQLDGGRLEISGFAEHWDAHPGQTNLECNLACKAGFEALTTSKILFKKS